MYGFEKKKGLNVRRVRGMVYDRNEWWGFVSGNAWDIVLGLPVAKPAT